MFKETSFDHILVPTDGSPLAWTAVGVAVRLAKASAGSITLLEVVRPVVHAIPIPSFAPVASLATVFDENATNELTATCSATLSEAARRLSETEGLPVDWRVLISNDVAKTIVDFAADHGVDSIAMSTHGRGMSRYLLGSVSDKVLRSSTVPVLVQRPVEAAEVEAWLSDAEVADQLPALAV